MSGKRVLVVEDSQDVLEIVSYMLQEMSHWVLQARDGNEALCLAGREPVDVLVTDIEMPGDGVELIKRLKADPCLKHIAVVAMTAGERGQAALAAGCEVVLPKPFRSEDLAAAITRASATSNGG